LIHFLQIEIFPRLSLGGQENNGNGSQQSDCIVSGDFQSVSRTRQILAASSAQPFHAQKAGCGV